MNIEKVIYEVEPRTVKWNIKFNVVFSTVIFVFTYLLSGEIWLSIMLSSVILILSLVASELESNSFDGIKINTNKLILSRNSMFGFRSVEIRFSDISKIIFSERMARKPRYLNIISKSKNRKVYLRFNIFEFADTLKNLKRNGINVEFERRDHEIELYLNDEIDKIPMENTPNNNNGL